MRRFIVIGALSMLFATTATPALAQISLDATFLSGTESESDIAGYVVKIYNFAVAAGGIAAVIMITIGAIKITTSGAIPSQLSEGKDYIYSAIWGLILLLGSYVILNTLNPRIAALELPPGGTIGACSGLSIRSAIPSKIVLPRQGIPIEEETKCEEALAAGNCETLQNEQARDRCNRELTKRNNREKKPIQQCHAREFQKCTPVAVVKGEEPAEVLFAQIENTKLIIAECKRSPAGSAARAACEKDKLHNTIAAAEAELLKAQEIYNTIRDPLFDFPNCSTGGIGSCAGGWKVSMFDIKPNIADGARYWRYPYYPKNGNPEKSSLEDPTQGARCVIYAYEEVKMNLILKEEINIHKADLTGLLKC